MYIKFFTLLLSIVIVSPALAINENNVKKIMESSYTDAVISIGEINSISIDYGNGMEKSDYASATYEYPDMGIMGMGYSTILETPYGYSHFERASIDHFENGKLYIKTFEFAESDPTCCPSIEIVTAYIWDKSIKDFIVDPDKSKNKVTNLAENNEDHSNDSQFIDKNVEVNYSEQKFFESLERFKQYVVDYLGYKFEFSKVKINIENYGEVNGVAIKADYLEILRFPIKDGYIEIGKDKKIKRIFLDLSDNLFKVEFDRDSKPVTLFIYPNNLDYFSPYIYNSQEQVNLITNSLNYNPSSIPDYLRMLSILGLPSQEKSSNVYTIPFEDTIDGSMDAKINSTTTLLRPKYFPTTESPLYPRWEELLIVREILLDNQLKFEKVFKTENSPRLAAALRTVLQQKIKQSIGNKKKFRFIGGPGAEPLTAHMYLEVDFKKSGIFLNNSVCSRTESSYKESHKARFDGYGYLFLKWNSEYEAMKCFIPIKNLDTLEALHQLKIESRLYPVLDIVYKLDDVGKKDRRSTVGKLEFEIDSAKVALYKLPKGGERRELSSVYDYRIFNDPRNQIEKLIEYKLK